MLLEKILITIAIIAVLLVIVILIVLNKKISKKIKILKLKSLIAFHKYDEARKYALKIVEKFPQSYVTHKLLAELYEKEGKWNIALDEYIKAVELNEADYEAHYKVADLLNKTEKNEEAIIMLQDLLRMKPDYSDASKLLGNILYDEERFKEAVSVYTDALKYNPTDYYLYYCMGMAYTRLNDFQKAKQFYDKAAILNTYLYNGQYDLALISMIQGELDEAESHLLQALQEEELNGVIYFYLAQIAIIRGHKDKAIMYLNLALEIDTKEIESRIKQQPLFIEIQDKLIIPNEERKIEIKLSKREVDINKYLEDMYSLVDSLNGSKMENEDNTEKVLDEVEQVEEIEKER